MALNPAKILFKETLRMGKEIEKFPALSYFISSLLVQDLCTISNIRKRFREQGSLSKNLEHFRVINSELSVCKKEIPWYQEIPKDCYPTYKKGTIKEISTGCLLIAHPIYIRQNSYFNKTVILILHSDDTSAFGIVLNMFHQVDENRKTDNQPEGYWSGGPVDLPVIVYTKKDLVPNGIEFFPGIYYIPLTQPMLKATIENTPKTDYRIFRGICCWTKPQLQNEIERENSWIISKNPVSLPNQVISTESETCVELSFQPPKLPYEQKEMWEKLLKSHWPHKEKETTKE